MESIDSKSQPVGPYIHTHIHTHRYTHIYTDQRAATAAAPAAAAEATGGRPGVDDNDDDDEMRWSMLLQRLLQLPSLRQPQPGPPSRLVPCCEGGCCCCCLCSGMMDAAAALDRPEVRRGGSWVRPMVPCLLTPACAQPAAASAPGCVCARGWRRGLASSVYILCASASFPNFARLSLSRQEQRANLKIKHQHQPVPSRPSPSADLTLSQQFLLRRVRARPGCVSNQSPVHLFIFTTRRLA